MVEPQFRLFILGAGFSKPAGLPLGPELLDQVRGRVKRKFQEFGWDGPLEREIQEWSQLYPKDNVKLESVMAYSHRKYFLGLIGSDECFSHGSETIVASRHAIQEILIERTPCETPQLYIDFARHLTPHDTVLSFNYDTLLEQALGELDVPYSMTPEWWLADEVAGDVEQEYKAKYVDLIKLHGSIDWYDNQLHDETCRYHAENQNDVPDRDPLFGPDPSITIERLARGDVHAGFGTDLLSRVFRVPNHREHFPIAAGSEVSPFLLPPAHDKLLGHDPVRDLWQNMHRGVDAYSSMTIIGYSIPDYDGYAYEALGRLIFDYQAASTNARFGHRRVPVQVVTREDSASKFVASIPFLDSRNTRVWHEGFSTEALEWLDWGSPL